MMTLALFAIFCQACFRPFPVVLARPSDTHPRVVVSARRQHENAREHDVGHYFAAPPAQ